MSQIFDRYIETLITTARTYLAQNKLELIKDLNKIYDNLYRRGGKVVASDDCGNGTLEVYIPSNVTIDEAFLYREFSYNEIDWNILYFYDSNIPDDAFYCFFNSVEVIFVWAVDKAYIRVKDGQKALLINRESKEIYWEIAITNMLTALDRGVEQV